jgi:hypothetical protein
VDHQQEQTRLSHQQKSYEAKLVGSEIKETIGPFSRESRRIIGCPIAEEETPTSLQATRVIQTILFTFSWIMKASPK